MSRTILYILILFGVTAQAQSNVIGIENFSIKYIEKNTKVLSFKNASYDSDLLPFFSTQLEGPYKIHNIKYTTSLCSAEESELLKQYDVPLSFNIRSSENTATNKIKTSILFYPWIIENGIYKKITEVTFDKLAIKNNNFQYRKTEVTSSSKLGSNSWFKFSIATDGVQKISYQHLVDNEILSEPIASSKIQILSNSAQMLPFINGDSNMDDLLYIPIKMFDNGDGVFNEDDYFLFYAEANGRNYYDKSANLIRHEINLYSDTNYVFIGLNGLANNDILEQSISTTNTDTVFNYTKLSHHEKEWLNFIKSGRIWVGEKFENQVLSFTEQYSPPYLENRSFNIEYNVCARSTNYTDNTIDLLINNNKISTSQINKVSSIYYNDYVKFKKTLVSGNFLEDTLGVKFNYNQLSNATAWLDYYTINTRQRISFQSEQIQIINFDSDNTNRVFNVATNDQINVWDITKLDSPKILQITKNINSSSFISNLDTIRKFIIFNENQVYTPTFLEKIAPQNLHEESAANYIIITDQKFTTEAERLITLHKTKDNLSGEIYYANEIYNEFSAGRPEATAIRNFIRMLYNKGKNTADSLQYVLLLGDGSYDPKHRLNNNINYIPTFQSLNSVKLTSSYVTDDIFGLMDDNEGDYTNGDLLDISIGRFPVKTLEQATNIVDKVFEYYNLYNTTNIANPFEKSLMTSNGSWKNNILFIADDEDYNEHMRQADLLANQVDTSIEKFNIRKILLDSYPQESTLSGNRSPEANKALIKSINEGALVINYTGHGGELGWTEEEILLVDDIHEMENRHTLPLFMTATCEFSRFDDPAHNSAGEYLILQKNGGAIALFTTVRLVFSIPNFKLNQTFYKVLKESINNAHIRLGDVFRLTKVRNNGGANDRNFTLLGDPALKLAFPLFNVNIDDIKIDNILTDTLKSLSKPVISGHIENGQNLLQSNYNGWAEVMIFDKKRSNITLDNDLTGLKFDYETQEDLLFKGRTKITNGKFSIETIIPKDIRTNFDFGKISIYAIDSAGQDAAGYSKKYIVGGAANNYAADGEGPSLEIFLEDTTFSFGDKVTPTPLFIGHLTDPSGINIMPNDIGKDITLTIDEDHQNTIVLNSKYNTKSNYKSGEVIYPIDKLENGRHSMVFKAYDNHNNSAQAYSEFIIEDNPKLALDHVLNYPNPFTTSTGFYFEHNQSSSDLNILIQILTISGRIIKTIESTKPASEERIGPIEWDGKDDYGDPIGKGVYIYNITVENSIGDKTNKLQKLVILR